MMLNALILTAALMMPNRFPVDVVLPNGDQTRVEVINGYLPGISRNYGGGNKYIFNYSKKFRYYPSYGRIIYYKDNVKVRPEMKIQPEVIQNYGRDQILKRPSNID